MGEGERTLKDDMCGSPAEIAERDAEQVRLRDDLLKTVADDMVWAVDWWDQDLDNHDRLVMAFNDLILFSAERSTMSEEIIELKRQSAAHDRAVAVSTLERVIKMGRKRYPNGIYGDYFTAHRDIEDELRRLRDAALERKRGERDDEA